MPVSRSDPLCELSCPHSHTSPAAKPHATAHSATPLDASTCTECSRIKALRVPALSGKPALHTLQGAVPADVLIARLYPPIPTASHRDAHAFNPGIRPTLLPT